MPRLMTRLKQEDWQAARHLGWHKLAKVFWFYAFVQQTVPDEGNQIAEFVVGQVNRDLEQRVEPFQDRLNRPKAVSEISGQAGLYWIVRVG